MLNFILENVLLHFMSSFGTDNHHHHHQHLFSSSSSSLLLLLLLFSQSLLSLLLLISSLSLLSLSSLNVSFLNSRIPHTVKMTNFGLFDLGIFSQCTQIDNIWIFITMIWFIPIIIMSLLLQTLTYIMYNLYIEKPLWHREPIDFSPHLYSWIGD